MTRLQQGPHIILWLLFTAQGCAVEEAAMAERHSQMRGGDAPAATTEINAVSGDISVVTGLVSVVPNESEDDEQMRIFQEQHALPLDGPLPYDIQAPASVDKAARTERVVAAGTTVNVYFVHFDPVGTATKHFSATADFPTRIVGVCLSSQTLEAGDARVGRSDVRYPKPGSNSERGLEYPSQDKLSFGSDGHSLELDLTTSTSSDQLRVITEAQDEADEP